MPGVSPVEIPHAALVDLPFIIDFEGTFTPVWHRRVATGTLYHFRLPAVRSPTLAARLKPVRINGRKPHLIGNPIAIMGTARP